MTWWQILLIVIGSVAVWITLSAVLYRPFFKRFYDILISGIAILVLSPIFIVLIIVGAIKMKGNPFFLQERPGKNEKIFKLIKFRTMSNARDKSGKLLPDEKRLNKYGRLLRRTSLDELPEIFNIFIGKMSIIGPRPLAVSYLPFFTDKERLRHSVRPGLTGWAQVNGRTAINWDRRFKYDLEYVDKLSFLFDIKVFFMTVFKVLMQSDVNKAVDQTDFDEFRRKQWADGSVPKTSGSMLELKGKKLLVLGGSVLELPLVARAKMLGIYTVVTDYYDCDTSPAKKTADEYWDISWSDIDALEKKCKESGINGVIAGYSEFRIENLIKLTSRLGLPCYITDSQLEITRDKEKFKNICRKNGVPVVCDYISINDVNKFPVIVKPVDRGGSIGVGIAYDAEQLKRAYDYAMELSVSKKVIIEDYIENGVKFDVYYAVLKGKPILLSTDDTMMSERQAGKVIQNCWVFPSRYTGIYSSTVRKKIENMIRDLGIYDGYIFISGFVLPDDSIVFFETGFRLSGEQVYIYTDEEGLTSVFDLLIKHALTGNTDRINDIGYSTSVRKCAVVNYYAKGGEIATIEGIKEISDINDCIYSAVFAKSGKVCDNTHAINQKLAMFTFVNKSPLKLADDIGFANANLIILDKNGEDMVFDRADNSLVAHWWDA